MVVVLIAVSMALAGGIRHRQAASAPAASAPAASAPAASAPAASAPADSAPAGPDGVPAYYIALTTQQKDSDIYDLGATAAEVRSTATGAVLAKVVPPKPAAACH
jgi:hypothetical protein